MCLESKETFCHQVEIPLIPLIWSHVLCGDSASWSSRYNQMMQTDLAMIAEAYTVRI